MPRDADSLRIRKWAADGNVTTPEDAGLDRSLGWTSEYSQPGGSLPQREVFNQLEREITALGEEVNKHGAGLPWDASIAYEHPALVTGSDGDFYMSLEDSTNVDPTTDGDTSHWEKVAGSSVQVTAATVPTGTILDFGGGTAPDGYLECNGAAVSRATYATLFAAIGIVWGSGDGSTTFNVPDLRGRVTAGIDGSAGRMPDGLDALGETGGSHQHALAVSEMPVHNHGSTAHSHSVGSHTHSGPSHAHSLGSHSHDGPSHNHSLGSHTHAGPSHSHSIQMRPADIDIDNFYSHGAVRDYGGTATNPQKFVDSGQASGTTGSATGNTGSGGNGDTGSAIGNTGSSGNGDTGAAGSGNTGSRTVSIGNRGSGQAHNNVQPTAVVMKMIKT